MKTENLILEYKNKIEKELNNSYTKGPVLLLNPINHVFSGKGKRIRPLLTLFTAKTAGCDIDESLDAAIAIEILHNFTLVHDDIMDKDKLRHGKKTVNIKWDNDIALLAGDAMLALGLKKLNSYSKNHLLFPTFVNGLLAVCEGQALDKEFENKDVIDISEYIKMIDLKTGYLIGLSSELGSIIAGVDKEEVSLLREFGRKIGRAFQIQDDILEIFSDVKTMGKSLKSDLMLGKKTFLMIRGENYNPGFISESKNLINKNYKSGLVKIREILLDTNVYNEGQDLVADNLNNANKILTDLKYDTTHLQYFVNLIGHRTF